MSDPGFETGKPDRIAVFNTCSGTCDIFLNFAETGSFLALRRAVVPPGLGWRSRVRIAYDRKSGIEHAQKQTSTSRAFLNLDCLLSCLWQKKRF